MPGPDEDLCYLSGDWRIFQRVDGHRWSLDDLVTAWYAARRFEARAPGTILDLGSGIGAVSMLLAWRFPQARALGVEAQELSVDLARRSLAWNGVTARCRVLLGDLRDRALLAAEGRFDLVTGTPPYLRPDTGTPSPRVQRAPCHIAYRGGIEDYCAAAALALAPGGWFVACEAAAAAPRVAHAAHDAGLRITRRRDVIPRAGKCALFSVYAMRRAGEGEGEEVVVEMPLVVRDEAGRRTADCRRLREEMGLPP